MRLANCDGDTFPLQTVFTWSVVFSILLVLLLNACAKRHLSKQPPPKTLSYAMETARNGQLAILANTFSAKFGQDTSAFLLIDHNDEALRWRLMLADLATQSNPGPGKITSCCLKMRPARAAPGWFTTIRRPASKGPQVRMVQKIDDLNVDAQKEMLIANAYFIPDEETVENTRKWTAGGVRVRILTNSLASNDVAIVNSGYKLWRRPVIEAGAELYELRHDAKERILSEDPRLQPEFLSLHSKVIAEDRKTSLVGSLNLDPRALKIHTEMGLVIEDPVLGERLAQIIERDMGPDNAWRVNINEEGKLYWESSAGAVYRQPVKSFWQRIEDGFFSLLPIKDQL